MPFYPALPEYKPMEIAGSIATGLALPQQLQYGALRNTAMRDAIERQQEERQALKTYAAGGGDRDLLAASPDLWGRLTKAQQGVVEGGMKEFRETAPFVTAQNYGPWMQDFSRKYPDLGKLFPPPEQMQTDDQVRNFITRGFSLATSLEAQREAAVGKARVGVKKEEWDIVGKPATQMEHDFRTKLTGIEFNNRLTLQQNEQRWHTAENKKKLDIERELKDARTDEQREAHFFTNFRQGQVHLNDAYMKALQKIDEAYRGPERDAKELELRRSYDDMQNELVKTYKPFADKYKIPFPYEVKEKPASGGDTTADRVKAEIERRKTAGTWK